MRISRCGVSCALHPHRQTDRQTETRRCCCAVRVAHTLMCDILSHHKTSLRWGCTYNVFVRENESRRETGPRDYRMTHKNHIHNNSSVSFKFSPPNCRSSRSLPYHIFAAVSLVFFLLVPSSLRLSPSHPHRMDRLRTILFHTSHPPVVIHSSLFICGDLDCLYFVWSSCDLTFTLKPDVPK